MYLNLMKITFDSYLVHINEEEPHEGTKYDFFGKWQTVISLLDYDRKKEIHSTDVEINFRPFQFSHYCGMDHKFKMILQDTNYLHPEPKILLVRIRNFISVPTNSL